MFDTPTATDLEALSSAEARALCEAAGLPLIAGAEATAEADQSTETEAASAPEPEAGTSEGAEDDGGTDQGFDPPFNINEVPEEIRTEVEKYNRQLQGEFTRKTQELATTREGEPVDIASELFADLEEDQQAAALEALAEKLGYEPTPAEVAEAVEEATEESPELEGVPTEAADLIKKLQGRVDELESGFNSEQTKQQQAALREHIVEGLDSYADKLDVEELPQPVVNQIMVLALNGPAGRDGLPDMEKAISAWEDAEQAVIASYKNSKPEDGPDLSGSSGVDDFDYADRSARLARAEMVAARHS